jgi:DNA-binding beta-propeller fold protein YncE
VSSFVPPGSAGLHGVRGFVFDQGNLLVVNQNVDLPKNGEVLRFNAQTGSASTPLVAASNPNAPAWPTGIVVRDNVAYVADTRDDSPSGRIAKYDATSRAFLGDLVPNNFSGEFRPRGLAFGPDGGLYVSLRN